MGPTDPAAAVFPIDLGAASTYDQRVFPLAYHDAGDNFEKGSLLIVATLAEMEAIKNLGIDLNKNEDFIFNTRLGLDDLRATKENLQDNRKTFNPFKAFLNYRAARLFHAASKALFLETKRTSEKIHREEERKRTSKKIQKEEERVQVVPTTQLRMVDGAIPPDAKIVGVTIDLPEGWSDAAERTINDAREAIATTGPFQDNSLISQLRDDEHAITLADTESLLSRAECASGAVEGDQTSAVSSDPQRSRPTSPQAINHIHIYQNSIVTTNSNLNGFTVNRGSRNSGASVTQEFAP